jgi:hypothetical protein
MSDQAIDESDPAPTPHGSNQSVVDDLRRARRERRLGDTEWFDVLYRAYLFALVGTIAVVVASDALDGLIDDDLDTARLLTRGPAIAGIAVMLAFGVGLRNGADGGPISVESADVRHLLMAPVNRTRVMVRPIAQRFRSVAFAMALTLGILGQLAAREIEGSRAAWAASGALFGVLLAALYVGTAVISHAIRMPRAVASAVFVAGLTWQWVVAWRIWTGDATGLARVGPGNLEGSVLFWGIRQRGIDTGALGVVAVLGVTALALGGRLRLEPLERRGQLVSQLRFAATVQDIRTVVQLRRQLRAESVRSRSLFGGSKMDPDTTVSRPLHRPHATGSTLRPGFVWRRGAVAIGRLPLGRWLRIGALAATAGAAASLAVTSSALLLVVVVAAAYLCGLESLEPLTQDIDHPDRTDALPIDRGWLFAHHLVAPAILVAAVGLIGAVAATLVEPAHAPAAFALAVPLAWAGAIGAVVTTISDASEVPSVASTTLLGAERGAESPFAMPEFAGVSQVAKSAIPLVLSSIAAVPIYVLSVEPTQAVVIRSIVGVALCLAMMVWWVRRRDRWSAGIRSFFVAGRAAQTGAS